MRYLALGDSISIDDYTGQAGGGAASQFARLIGAEEFVNLTRDGCTTAGVMDALDRLRSDFAPDVVTLTAGGNDLLQLAFQAGTLSSQPGQDLAGDAVSLILGNLNAIAAKLKTFGCPVIVSTIYDPTDGDDALAEQMGIPRSWRAVYNGVNDGIKAAASTHGFLLADLEALFHGHGLASREPWFVMQIEPNLAGASAIARHWHELFARG